MNRNKLSRALIILRVLAGIFLLASAVSLPWWITLMAGIVFSLKFKRYWEFPIAGLVIDSLFSSPSSGELFDLKVATLLIFAAIFVSIEYMKNYLNI